MNFILSFNAFCFKGTGNPSTHLQKLPTINGCGESIKRIADKILLGLGKITRGYLQGTPYICTPAESFALFLPGEKLEYHMKLKIKMNALSLMAKIRSQKGAIKFVKTKSEKGAVCNISNPWPGKKITLYRDGKVWKKLKGTLLSFDTYANKEYVIMPNGVSLSRISHSTQHH